MQTTSSHPPAPSEPPALLTVAERDDEEPANAEAARPAEASAADEHIPQVLAPSQAQVGSDQTNHVSPQIHTIQDVHSQSHASSTLAAQTKDDPGVAVEGVLPEQQVPAVVSPRVRSQQNDTAAQGSQLPPSALPADMLAARIQAGLSRAVHQALDLESQSHHHLLTSRGNLHHDIQLFLNQQYAGLPQLQPSLASLGAVHPGIRRPPPSPSEEGLSYYGFGLTSLPPGAAAGAIDAMLASAVQHAAAGASIGPLPLSNGSTSAAAAALNEASARAAARAAAAAQAVSPDDRTVTASAPPRATGPPGGAAFVPAVRVPSATAPGAWRPILAKSATAAKPPELLQLIPRLYASALAFRPAEPGEVSLQTTYGGWVIEVVSMLFGLLAFGLICGLLTVICVIVLQTANGGVCPVPRTECLRVASISLQHNRKLQLMGACLCFVFIPFSVCLCQGQCACFNICKPLGPRFLRLWRRFTKSLQGFSTSCCRCRCWRETQKVSPESGDEGVTTELESGEGDGRNKRKTKPKVAFDSVTPEPAVPAKLSRRVRQDSSASFMSNTSYPDHWRCGPKAGTGNSSSQVVDVDIAISGNEWATMSRIVLSGFAEQDVTPQIIKIKRIEHLTAWRAYTTRKTRFRSSMAWRGLEDVASLGLVRPVLTRPLLAPQLAKELDVGLNEQLLLLGIRADAAKYVQETGLVPMSFEADQKPRFGPGCYFSETGAAVIDQLKQAGFPDESDKTTPLEDSGKVVVVLICRVLLGKALAWKRGIAAGPLLWREWESGRYGSIMDKRDGFREFILPKEECKRAYPEYAVFLRLR